MLAIAAYPEESLWNCLGLEVRPSFWLVRWRRKFNVKISKNSNGGNGNSGGTAQLAYAQSSGSRHPVQSSTHCCNLYCPYS